MIDDIPEDNPPLPAPDFEDFDVGEKPSLAEWLYVKCKRIAHTALLDADAGKDIGLNLRIWIEYQRAAEQLRHRYQSFWNRGIHPNDKVDARLQPILTPSGIVQPTFKTSAEIYQQLLRWLRKKYPKLLPHWSKD